MNRCMICGQNINDGGYRKPGDGQKCLACIAKGSSIVPPDPNKAAYAARKRAEKNAREKEHSDRLQEERKRLNANIKEAQRIKEVKEREAKRNRLVSLFSGLKEIIPNYVHRDSQIQIASAIEEALMHKSILLVEAGVGTGKTFAYLIPSIIEKCAQELSKDGISAPIVISTKTINLQEQLQRDIKNIRDLLFRAHMHSKMPSLQDDSDIIISKGKRNYCCRKNLYDLKEKLAAHKQDQELLLEVEKWLDEGGSEFNEESAPRINESQREELAVERCAQDCLFSHDCRYCLMKDHRKYSSGIIVTNHNQLISDLKLRKNGKGFLWRMPYEVIIDEAHALKEVARNELAIRVSVRRIQRTLIRASENNSIQNWKSDFRPYLETLARLDVLIGNSIGQLPDTGSLAARYPLTLSEPLKTAIRAMLKAAKNADNTINIILSSINGTRGKLIQALESITSNLEDIIESLEQYAIAIDDGKHAFWAEKDRRGNMTLVVAPLDPGKFLSETLLNARIPVIMTSGTMRTNRSFEYFEKDVGLSLVPERFRETPLYFGSPYDYEKNVLIYVPKDLPEPKHMEDDEDIFAPAIARRIHELLTYSRGRALVLFTSYYRLGIAYEYLWRNKLGYTILKQGDAAPNIVLERFRQDNSSVLLATGAFWEGTDVAGDALSLLILDKLPFPVPSDPLTAKVMDVARQQGKDPQRDILLPMMLTALSQGSGRLIRKEGDSGVIALLDVRAWNTRYNSIVAEHLPPSPWTSNISAVQEWFAKRTSCLAVV